VPEVDRSNSKLRGSNSALPFGPHPSHVECGTADHRKAEKLLHAIEVLIATLFVSLGKYSTGNRGGANDCSRAARSYGAAIGDGLLSRAPPAEAYHPGTALADHRDIEESGDARARLMPVGSLALMMGVPDLQMSIEGLL